VKHCLCKPRAADTEINTDAVVNGRLLLEAATPVTNTSNKQLQQVLDSMRNGTVASIAKKDSFIMQFGSVLLRKLGRSRAHDVPQRMRQLARLKIQLKVASKSSKSLMMYISGANFDTVIDAVNKLCGLTIDDIGRHWFTKPSLALKLGHSLVKCAQVKKGMAIREDKVEMRREAESYMDLHTSEYSDLVSSTALAKLKQKKYNKPLALPLTND